MVVSGTSGRKAAVNRVLNLSMLHGWSARSLRRNERMMTSGAFSSDRMVRGLP
jgi:hypothetical protein